MRLSIITINYNNAAGLKKTLDSVAAQTYPHIQHIIVDGGSTDNSVELLKAYALASPKSSPKGKDLSSKDILPSFQGGAGGRLIYWVSEPDSGIYNAMNKGIEIALGKRIVNEAHTSLPIANSQSPIAITDYIQILNSGDILAAPDVTERMINALQERIEIKDESLKFKGRENGEAENSAYSQSPIAHSLPNPPAIFYGNMKKVLPNGTMLNDTCNGGNDVTLNMFYRGCLNHSPAYIKRSLFDKYGMYDESLRICSDWKFYMQSIVLGGESVEYVDIDVTIFDMTGISETNKDLLNAERNQLLKEMVPPGILRDYELYHFPIEQYNRLKKHHLWGLVYFIERVLFKLEKWHIIRK